MATPQKPEDLLDIQKLQGKVRPGQTILFKPTQQATPQFFRFTGPSFEARPESEFRTADAQRALAQLSPEGGFQLPSFTGGAQSELFKFFRDPAKETARITTENFGMGFPQTPEQQAHNSAIAQARRTGTVAPTGGTIGLASTQQTTPQFTGEFNIAEVRDAFKAQTGRFGTFAELQEFFDQRSGTQPITSTTPVPTVAPQAGQQIASPEQLAGLNEKDIARTSGDEIFRRDFNREQQALAGYARKFGAPQSDEDWRKFHDFVYKGDGTLDGIDINDDGTFTITPDLLQDVDGIDFPDPTSTLPSANSTIAESQQTLKSLEQYINQLTTPTGEVGTQAQQITDRLSQLEGELTGRSEDLADELEKRNVEQLRQQLVNVQNELAQRVASFRQLHAEIEGKPITMDSIIGQQAQARAVAQADIMFLEARASALQNNIVFAQEQAERATDIKYGPILDEISIKERQLELLQPQLEREEQLIAQAQLLLLQDQRAIIEEQKANDQLIQDIAITAIQNLGIIDQNVIAQIQRAQSPTQAMLIMQRNIPVTTTPDEFEFIRGTSRQQPGVFNPVTGEFTPTGGVPTVSDGVTEFSATERKKLEQAGLLNASRQQQLDFLFGTDEGISQSDVDFHVNEILKENPTFVDIEAPKGEIVVRWDKIPDELQPEISQRLAVELEQREQAEAREEQFRVGAGDVVRGIPDVFRGAGQRFLDLF